MRFVGCLLDRPALTEVGIATETNMIRCKNWLCSRYNNNDYAGVSTATTATNNITATAAYYTNTSSSNITVVTRKQQQQQQQQQQQHHTAANGNAYTGYAVHQTPQHGTNATTTSTTGTINTCTATVTTTTTSSTANIMLATTVATTTTTTIAAAAATSAAATNIGGNVHAVTFLDDIPSGSNGVVNTTTRLMTNIDMQHAHLTHQRHMSDDTADGFDTSDDFMANQVVSTAMLCDDTLPTSKNCYRLVILGSSRVGKSSIIARFLGNRFEEAYTPTIEDFHRKLYRIRNEVYQLDILDTSGYHPFPAMRRLSFLTGDLFILVFSMDSRESFEEVVRLRENILETKWAALNPGSGFKKKTLPKIPMILAGNKCDREVRVVQLDEIMGYIAGQDNCCVFVECSAKQNFHIDDLFYALFTVSNLPLEMAPNHHRRVITQFGAPSPLPPHSTMGGAKKNALSIKRRFSDACGVVTPNARRPSIRTDLNLMRSKTMGISDGGDGSSARKKCNIM